MPTATLHFQNGRTLGEICLDVHMAAIGSSDCGPGTVEDVNLLIAADQNWEPYRFGISREWEAALRSLVRATIREAFKAEIIAVLPEFKDETDEEMELRFQRWKANRPQPVGII